MLQERYGLLYCRKVIKLILPELLEEVRDLEPVSAPEFLSSYCNVGYVLLGFAIEKVTGESFTSVLQNLVLDPLSMTSTSLTNPEQNKAALREGDTFWNLDLDAYNAFVTKISKPQLTFQALEACTARLQT